MGQVLYLLSPVSWWCSSSCWLKVSIRCGHSETVKQLRSGEATVLERMQQRSEEHKLPLWHYIQTDKVLARQLGKYGSRDIAVPDIAAEQHPPFRKKKWAQECQKASTGKNNTKTREIPPLCISVMYCCSLAWDTGRRVPSAPAGLPEDRTHGAGKLITTAVTANTRSQSEPPPSSNRPEPFSEP